MPWPNIDAQIFYWSTGYHEYKWSLDTANAIKNVQKYPINISWNRTTDSPYTCLFAVYLLGVCVLLVVRKIQCICDQRVGQLTSDIPIMQLFMKSKYCEVQIFENIHSCSIRCVANPAMESFKKKFPQQNNTLSNGRFEVRNWLINGTWSYLNLFVAKPANHDFQDPKRQQQVMSGFWNIPSAAQAIPATVHPARTQRNQGEMTKAWRSRYAIYSNKPRGNVTALV